MKIEYQAYIYYNHHLLTCLVRGEKTRKNKGPRKHSQSRQNRPSVFDGILTTSNLLVNLGSEVSEFDDVYSSVDNCFRVFVESGTCCQKELFFETGLSDS